MNRRLLFMGIVVLVAGAMLIFISGMMNGAGAGAVPSFPFLYSLQLVWTLLAVAGLALVIAGFVFKEKK